jgi:hypothetical protein
VTHALVLLALLSLSACSTTTTWTRPTSSMEASQLVRDANVQLREETDGGRSNSRTPYAGSRTRPVTIRPSTIWLGPWSYRPTGDATAAGPSAHLDRLLREYPAARMRRTPVPSDRPQRVRRAIGRLDRLLERLKAIDLSRASETA